MRRIDDSQADIRHGRRGKAVQVGAIAQPAHQADVVGSRRADGVQQQLHTRRGKGRASARAAIKPNIPGGGVIHAIRAEGFVVKVEKHRGIVLEKRRH